MSGVVANLSSSPQQEKTLSSSISPKVIVCLALRERDKENIGKMNQ
jgi:hypothetical protein